MFTDGLDKLYAEPQYPDGIFDATAELAKDYTKADWQYEVILKEIKDFEKNLDNDHEVALKLASFGQSITMSVTEIGYQNPCLIYYYGYVNGKYCQLIQHVSQISFLMIAEPKSDPLKNPRRVIGFRDTEDT